MSEIFYLKFGGKVNVPEKVAIGHNYRITADCSVVSEQKSDLENGDFAVTSKIMPITCEISKDNGKIIKAKDARSMSQLVRNNLWNLWFKEGCVIPFEEVYEQCAYLAMRDAPQFLREAIKRLEK